MKKRFSSFLWQFVKHGLTHSLLVTILVILIVTNEENRGFFVLLDRQIVGVPILLWIVVLILVSGFVSGLLQADPLKRRMESLLHGAALYERGTFSHRIRIEGEDELSELVTRMNSMAGHMEEKVASLQRLSTRNANMQDTVKRAAVTEERQRLARELHDAVSQQLFAISMMMAAIKEGAASNREINMTQLKSVEKMANLAQSEMRSLLLHLRPTQLKGRSLKEGLDQLFLEMQDKQNLQVVHDIEADLKLPQGFEDQLFRMVQEAFSNILRHAEATKVECFLKTGKTEWKLTIIDNGVGFDSSEISQGSYGLQTMRERMNEIGGILQVKSAKGKGTQIEAKVPLAWREDSDD
ncbi:sensor histidine kinase [Alkalicoccobacillus murimartini]|uniref:Sensor histidine kinase n=1 Tax=Alkalicoccobacillus murimartini TaxID=171685 RepID=A0ABT9YBV8_9BACI|nr:sensor histidine kinase [Alkalicoccobacillus murimartini]MDQ0205327.1 NarL family two-component system sensor histidine kinase LiaS [Alkalicoccobacillus murimartini]